MSKHANRKPRRVDRNKNHKRYCEIGDKGQLKKPKLSFVRWVSKNFKPTVGLDGLPGPSLFVGGLAEFRNRRTKELVTFMAAPSELKRQRDYDRLMEEKAA